MHDVLCYTEKATEARHRLERQHNACANRKKQCRPNETKPYSNATHPRKRQKDPTRWAVSSPPHLRMIASYHTVYLSDRAGQLQRETNQRELRDMDVRRAALRIRGNRGRTPKRSSSALAAHGRVHVPYSGCLIAALALSFNRFGTRDPIRIDGQRWAANRCVCGGGPPYRMA